jgi:hypothetical protein
MTDQVPEREENQQDQQQVVEEVTSESSVQEIVQWIREGIDEERTGSDIIRVIMDIPPARRVPGKRSAAALKEIMAEYSIQLPPEVLETLESGRAADFSFAAPAREKYLRPRSVIINTAPEVCTLMIAGEEPVDGVPGFTEIHYDFSVKSGKLFSDGSIDFREINMFPQAKEGELLLRIFEPTEGVAGTDVYGWRVAPVPGEPVRIEFGDNITTSRDYDEEQERDYIDVSARKPGIIVTDFGGASPKAENIIGISIHNRLELNDIDFTTGNVSGNSGELRCTADVSVSGDIRGSFSVLIEGMLEVKGTVEGERIDASGEVIAHLVRSSIRSGRFINAVSATNAKLIAEEYIQITREFTHCTMKAPEVILENEHGREVLCGSADISAYFVRAANVEIRNRLEIVLGEKLISQLQALEKSRDQLENQITAEETHLKARAHTFGKKLQLTYSIVPDQLKKIIVGIKNMGSKILSGSMPPQTASNNLTKLSQSLGAEFLPLLDQLKRIAKIQEVRLEKIEKLNAIGEQIGVTINELKEMAVDINGSITSKGHVIIRCGNHEEHWQGEGHGSDNFEIHIGYDPETGLYSIQDEEPRDDGDIDDEPDKNEAHGDSDAVSDIEDEAENTGNENGVEAVTSGEQA